MEATYSSKKSGIYKASIVCDDVDKQLRASRDADPIVEKVPVQAPDGGYGWVVVVATFYIYVSICYYGYVVI